MSDDKADRLSAFLVEYQDYHARILTPTYNQLRDVLQQWKKDPKYWASYTEDNIAPSPIQRARADIKRPESILDKIKRKPSDYPEGTSTASLRKMPDAVRGRAVVYFLSQLALVNREIFSLADRGLWEISQTSPPTAFMNAETASRYGLAELRRQEKDSGYVSLHYLLRFADGDVAPNDRPWVELQVRTMAEDVWGEVEHILGYKPNKRTQAHVKKQFWILSQQLTTIDEFFNFFYEDLSRYQDENQHHVNDNDVLNPETLPAVLSKVGLGCSQGEVDGLLKVLSSHSIKTAGDFWTLATQQRIERIRHTTMSQTGAVARNFEIVATLASLKGSSPDQEPKLIATHIQYMQAWYELKKQTDR